MGTGITESAEQTGILIEEGTPMKVDHREIGIKGRMLRIAQLDADAYRILYDPKPVIESLRTSPHRPDLFTFVQDVTQTTPLHSYPWEFQNFAVIPISTYEHWFEKQIISVARNRVRQAAKKGAVLREVPFGEELVKGIWGIYNETPVRQGRRFPHYGKDMETVYREAATYLDSSIFVGAYMGEELIGFIKIVCDEGGIQAGLMNILSKMAHRDKAPTNALVGEAVRACAIRGIPNLTYGCFAFANQKRDNLTDFKEKNGFKRVDVPRYYVPLTAWGAAAFRLGLHQRWVDRIPENVGHKLRELRARWYKRKQSAVQGGAGQS